MTYAERMIEAYKKIISESVEEEGKLRWTIQLLETKIGHLLMMEKEYLKTIEELKNP